MVADFETSLSEHKTPVQEIVDEVLNLLPRPIREILEVHLREILSGIAIAVLVVALWGGYTTYSAHQEASASTAVGEALSMAPDGRLAALKDVTKNFSGTKAADNALLLLAAAQMQDGKMDEALADFRKAQGKLPEGTALSVSATMGVGYIEEEQGKLEDARAAYEAAVKANQGYAPVALLDLARVEENLGHNDKALEAYNQYLSLEPESDILGYVRYRVMRLSNAQSAKGE